MSFGYSAGEIFGLIQLAWQIAQNTRKACGEHDELTREVISLHAILLRVQHSALPADPSLNPHNDIRTRALRHAIDGLRIILQDLDEILEKHNSLSENQRATTKLWNKIRFGNGPMLDLGQIRMKIAAHMAVINAHLNVGMSADIRKMQGLLEKIAGRMAGAGEGTVLTSYDGDDKDAWRELRRELRNEGFEDSFVRERKETIIEYIRELGRRGFFDVDEANNTSSAQDHPGLGFGEQLHEGAAPKSREEYNSFSDDSYYDDEEERSHYSLSDASEGDSGQEDSRSDMSEQNVAGPDPAKVPRRSDELQSKLQHIYRQCINCEEREYRGSKRSFTKLKCKHYWCSRCLHYIFVKSLTSPADMPPKCCTEDPIPPRTAQHFFTGNFITIWNRKWFEGLVKNPAYCPRTECGALIFPGLSLTERVLDRICHNFAQENLGTA